MSADPTTKTINDALTACYVISIVVALLGNSFVIAAVLRVPDMKNPSNYMFVHMAVADLLTAITIMPRMVAYLQVEDVWAGGAFGDFLCKLVMYVFHITIAASVLALSIIACDRFFAIVWTIRRSTFFTRKKTIAALIWFSSAVLMVPIAIVFKNDTYINKGETTWICYPVWTPLGQHGQRVFYTYILVFVYIMPLSIIAAMYFLICRKLWFRKVPGHVIDRNQRVAQANKRNVVRMLIIIVVVFALCWLPAHVMHILMTYNPEKLRSNSNSRHIMSFSFWLAQANSAINPCLYISLNARFRKIFINMILRRSPRQKPSDCFKLVQASGTKQRVPTGPTVQVHVDSTTLTDDRRKISWRLKSLVHKK